MDFIHHAPARRASALAGLLLAAAALTACSGTSGPAPVATGIAAGAGQSPAGMPGSTGTGAAPAAAASGDPMPSMTMIMTAPGGSGAPAAPVAGDAVAIKNFAFAPAALTVKVGTTVTWTNQDSDNHTVTSQGSGGPLQSAALDTGQSYSYTFTKPGTYSYYCTIHPFMIATVTVTQ